MAPRCKLCRRRITDPSVQVCCECGWVMDRWCDGNHHGWCPRHGEDRWIGAVEF